MSQSVRMHLLWYLPQFSLVAFLVNSQVQLIRMTVMTEKTERVRKSLQLL